MRPATLAVVAAAIACSEPTAPPAPFALTLRVAQVHAAQTFELPDGPAISCGVDLEAEVTGSGVAFWQGATFYWFAGGDRSEAIDSLRVGPVNTRASWSADSVSALRTEAAAWDFSGRAPFDAEAHFRYLVGGETDVRSAVARFSCGPKLPLGGAAAPSIVADPLSVAAELAPGDTIRVTYAALSPFGLWSTGIFVNEAWTAERRHSERMVLASTRTAELVVPRGAPLDVPFRVHAFAEDVGLQLTIHTLPGTLRIVDRVPPLIMSTGALLSEYRVGDRISIIVRGTDNNQLGWLVYTLGAPANVVDSVQSAAVPAADWHVPLLVQAGWVGTITLTVLVRDAAGLASEVVNLAPTGVRIVP